MESKTAQDSLAVLTEIVMPNQTNNLDNLMGGQLLHWMDMAGAIAAHRHCDNVVVTASVNHVSFGQPIKRADIVTIEAKVSRSFNSSMETYIDVFVEGHMGRKIKSNEAIYTFVAVDPQGKPMQVPELVPETDIEKERYEGALRRRQLSLVLAGKMKPDEATELKALFTH